MFEIIKTDLAGRIGTIQTNHGKVETPAYVPVIHPVKQSIPCRKIRDMGFDLVITNSYIAKNSYGNKAIEQGIHAIIDYDGAIMTDSGGYQVLEYGDVNATPQDIADYEKGIMTDFAIPLDKPTGFGLSRKKAESYVKHTLQVSKKTLDDRLGNGQIWIGPIQGGEHFELVRESTKRLVEYGFRMLALGSPVEFMESYEYRLLFQMIMAAKKEMPYSVPLHLFGAGHPLTIPFAIALGCDTFDSASYMLYAKQDRYITEDGTRHLSEIQVFPCNCEICSKFTPKELQEMVIQERINSIALHNLYAIKEEVDKTKQAIFEGRLWEYVMKKARAHPKLFEATDIMTTNSSYLAQSTPKFKEKAIFLYDKEDQFRPEIQEFHKIVKRFKTKKKILILSRESKTRPAYLSKEYDILKRKVADLESVQVCQYNPFLGIIPIEISDMFPASHHETSRIKHMPQNFASFDNVLKTFLSKNSFSEIYYDKDDEFLNYFLKSTAKKIKKKPLSKLKIRKKNAKDTV